MSSCSKCGKNIGLLDGKHKFDDGMIICDSCFKNWKDEQESKKEQIMIDLLSKYLVGKDEAHTGIILSIYQNRHGEIRQYWDEYSLVKLKTFYRNILDSVESQQRGRLTKYDLDEIIRTKEVAEGVLDFLNNLDNLYSLFEKKGVRTNYSEILFYLSNIIENNLNENIDKEIVNPAYIKISKKLGEKISKEEVIKEFLKIPIDIDYIQDINDPFSITRNLLDKFNLQYDKIDIINLIIEIQKEKELEDFEQNLGSQKKEVELGDYSSLNGYEFESYLKNIFENLGFTVVATSLSGDQGADLILSKDGEKTVVQAKKYNNPVSNKAVQEIVAARNHYNAKNAMVVTNSSFTSSALELALSNNVELWDGEKLKNIVNGVNTTTKRKELSYKKTYNLKNKENLQKLQALCPFCEESFEFEFDSLNLNSRGNSN